MLAERAQCTATSEHTCKLGKQLHQFVFHQHTRCKYSQRNQIKKSTANRNNTCKLRKKLTTQPNKETCSKSNLYLFVLWGFYSTGCQTDEDVFVICWCFFYLHGFSEVAERWALSAIVIKCSIESNFITEICSLTYTMSSCQQMLVLLSLKCPCTRWCLFILWIYFALTIIHLMQLYFWESDYYLTYTTVKSLDTLKKINRWKTLYINYIYTLATDTHRKHLQQFQLIITDHSIFIIFHQMLLNHFYRTWRAPSKGVKAYCKCKASLLFFFCEAQPLSLSHTHTHTHTHTYTHTHTHTHTHKHTHTSR